MVVEQIEQIVEAKVEAKKDVLSPKEDLLNVRNELSEKIHLTERTMIFWYIGIGLVQTGTVLGFLYFMLRK